MIDPTPKQPPDSHADQTARASHSTRSWRIAGVLSAILILCWAAFVVMSPSPTRERALAPSPAATQQQSIDRGIDAPLRLIAPRRLIDAQMLADFETATGAKVELVTYTDEESFRATAVASARNADVVLSAGPTTRMLADADLLRVLPLHRIDAASSLDPGMIARAAAYDPERFHALPFAWVTVGIGFNRAAVAARLGPTAVVDSWALMFDPQLAAQLASCGLQSLDTPAAAFPAALAYLNRDPSGSGVADIEAAASLWDGVKGFFSKFDSQDVARNLINGSVCAAIAASADVYQARAEARASGASVDLAYIVPREGAMLRLYLLAITAPPERVDRAGMLVAYLLRADTAANMTNRHWAANTVPRSKNFLRPDIQEDPYIYPDAEVMARLTIETPLIEADSGLRSRLWRLINAPPKRP